MEELKEHVRKVYATAEKRKCEKIEHNDLLYKSDNYNPPKNSVSVTYMGTKYKSKKQCCYCENITMNTLNKYLLKNE